MNIKSNLLINLFTKTMLFLIFILVIISCDKDKNPVSPENEQSNWRDLALQHKLNPDTLEAGFNAAKTKEWIYSILIMRHDTLIAEEYFYPENAYSGEHPEEVAKDIWSCTKSVTSALVGIAIDKGYIESVEKKMMDFYQLTT